MILDVIYFDAHMISDCSHVYWVYFCQKHLVSKDSYMSNSTTHFSQQTMASSTKLLLAKYRRAMCT